MKRKPPSRQANIWVARGVPVFLLGIVGYASWVVTKELCVDYLLLPQSNYFAKPQVGSAAAILTIYYILFFVMLVCYARLLYVVTKYPGLVPRGSHWYEEQRREHRSRSSTRRRKQGDGVEKSNTVESESDSQEDGRTAEAVTDNLAVDSDIRVGDFWRRNVFTCNPDGRPAFCSTCYNWKPDRAHHCSELDRCVLKMDHFCPWVGGVVGETSFKFFIQFTFWAALFCTHALVVVAYFFAQRKHNQDVLNVHWMVTLALSALFWLFSAGMCASSLQFVFINSTTIENLSRKRKVWYLAVHISENVLLQLEQRGRSNLKLITYPRPQAERYQALEQYGADVSREMVDGIGHQEHVAQTKNEPVRTFAILESAPGSNPFDLGWKQNFTDIMGETLFEWLLPVRLSPCVQHESSESFYKMGSVLDAVKRDAKIVNSHQEPRRHSRKRRHRKNRSMSHENRQEAQAH